MAHQREEDAFLMEFARCSAMSAALLGANAGRCAGVAFGVGIAAQLSPDGARRSPQHLGHCSNTDLLLDQAGQRHTVFRLKLLRL